jgi:hypothetical protein
MKKKCMSVIAAASSLAGTVAAEEWRRSEVYLGYTCVRANPVHNIPAFSANGGSGQFVHNFNK